MKAPLPAGSNSESVWDYPRPPRVEPTTDIIRVVFNGVEIAHTTSAYRVLETSHPPTYYIPQKDVAMMYLRPTSRRSFCEFKGTASYWSIEVNGRQALDAAWMYANPAKGYEVIQNHLAFYASKVDACFVGDEQVQPQEGDFYGGWITSRIVGPFKGAPGTWGW
jgi:uncharacterized protein (DUF427 family)